MIPAVFRTEEREKEVLFSNLPMGTLYVTLNVRVDDKRYGYEDFSSFQGMRVGIIRGSSDGERFQRYCEKFGVKPIIVPYAETQALLSALEDGTLDGVAITHLAAAARSGALPSSLRSRCMSLWRRTGRICSPVLMRR